MSNLTTPTTFKRLFAGDDDSYAGKVPAADLFHVAGSYGPILRVTSTPLADSVSFAAYGYADARYHGATGDGVTIDSLALQAAADALTVTGGVLFIPPGNYLIDRPLKVDPNVTISGWGAKLIACPIATWFAADKFAITNRNNTASVLTDSNITIRGLTFDFMSFETWVSGGIHIVYMRLATNVNVVSCRFLGGDDHTAFLGCDGTNVESCYSVGASNCTYDHWNGAKNARVSNCHATTALASQIVNFNAQNTDGTTAAASGFILTGCTLISTAATATPLQIEPLGPVGSSINNVIISDNLFVNCYLVIRGRCDNYLIDNNVFRDTVVRQAIIVNTSVGETPDAISITNNSFYNPTTTSGLGVVQVVATNYKIINNSVYGSGYSTNPGISAITNEGIVFGNYVSNGVINLVKNTIGTIGFNLNSDDVLGFYDIADSRAKFKLQSSDNNFIFAATGSAGAERVVWAIVNRSDTTEFTVSVPTIFNGTLRTTPATLAATGTVIGTATSLTANLNNVTTCTAGVADGVRLVASTGREQTVINSSAATLKVYPNNSGTAQIDAGGASIPATIAAGKSKTFVQVVADDFRTISLT